MSEPSSEPAARPTDRATRPAAGSPTRRDATEWAIRTVDLRVDFGNAVAVRDLCLEIPIGEIFGLIGPNGAGKTTTMRVLATLQEPTYGSASILGVNVLREPRGVHRVLGYMPDQAPVYPDLRVWEFLDLFASAYGLPPRRRRIAVDKALELVDLSSRARDLAGTLSRGLMQRLVLAKTLLPDPRVLILDEPASGLDPAARIDLRRVLGNLAVDGRTVLISSHVLAELEGFCTSIGILSEGRLLLSGRLEEILAQVQTERTLLIQVLGAQEAVDRARELLATATAVTRVEVHPGGELRAGFRGKEADKAGVLARLVGAGVLVTSFREDTAGVEEVFLQVGAGSRGAAGAGRGRLRDGAGRARRVAW